MWTIRNATGINWQAQFTSALPRPRAPISKIEKSRPREIAALNDIMASRSS